MSEDLTSFQLRVNHDIEKESNPTVAALREALRNELPRTYDDYGRAYDLFVRAALSPTLQERQRYVSEIERLRPRGSGPSATATTTSPGGHEDMKTGQMFPSKYLKADDLPDGYRADLLIHKFRMEEIESDGRAEEKPVLYFQGAEKGLVLNRTNADALTDILGSDDSDDWLGKVVCVFKTKVRFGDKRVNAVRIDPAIREQAAGSAPPPPAPAQAPVTEPDDSASVPQTRAEGWTPSDDDVPF